MKYIRPVKIAGLYRLSCSPRHAWRSVPANHYLIRTNNRKNQVVHPGDSCSSQGIFAQSSQENIIGDKIDLWYKYGEADRQSDL